VENNMRIRSIRLALAVGAAVGLGASAHATDLIVNGDFSTPNVGGGFTLQPSIPGWVNTNGDAIEVGFTGLYGLPCFTSTCQNLEVNATTFDTDSQTVSGLIVGKTYNLSYAYGGRDGGGPQALDVSFGGTLLTTDTSDNGVNDFWAVNSFVVVATATSETLTFQALDVGGSPGAGNEVTAVSLDVPEPESWALMLVGFGGLGAVARRRRGVLAA
jgi:hypothetical protein